MSDEFTELRVAVAATGDGGLPDTHFGEAQEFAVYRMTAGGWEWVETVPNRVRAGGEGESGRPAHAPHESEHRHGHGDAHKGAGIGRLLAGHGIQVIVSRAFGPNITRIRQRFVPVVVHLDEVEAAMSRLRADWDRVCAEWARGEARKHVVLRG